VAKVQHGSRSEAIRGFLKESPDASPKQIVDGLKAKGIEVSTGLASAIKYGKNEKKVKKAGAGKSAAASSSGDAGSASADGSVSGSESIRQYIARFPNAKPKEILAGLKAEGVTVKSGLISAVKYHTGKKQGKKKRRAATLQVAVRTTTAAPKAVASFTSDVTIEQLLEVKRLADAMGGAEHVRKALETLDQLR